MVRITAGRLAVFFLVVTIAGFIAWMALGAYDVREDTWTAWSNAIDIIWKIIPASLVASIVCGIIAATTKTSRTTGAIVLIIAVAFAIYAILMLTHLGIQ